MNAQESLNLILTNLAKLTLDEQKEFLDSLPDEARQIAVRYVILREVVRAEISPASFKAFYQLIHWRQKLSLPDHVMYEWIVPLFWGYGFITAEQAREYYQKGPARYRTLPDELISRYQELQGKPKVEDFIHAGIQVDDLEWAGSFGIVIEAARGSTKTTSMTTLAAYLIGKFPARANIILRVGDDSGQASARAVADIIEFNEGWKLAFPEIVPDKDKGWGAQGYEVKHAGMEYTTWREVNSARQDPTLLGLGYRSNALIGKHPDGFLLIDDIHNEINTGSIKELGSVISILTGTIFPMATETTLLCAIGTPWVEGDALDYMKQTNQFICLKTPVLRFEEHGEHEFEGSHCTLTMPELFGLKDITRQKSLVGEREFGRMFLLSLLLSQADGIRYLSYPAEQLDPHNMTTGGGCDPAFIYEERQRDEKNRSYFADVWLVKAKEIDCLVIFDGVMERCTQLEAEQQLWKLQKLYPKTCRGTGFETAGRGQESYYNIMLRNPGLKLIPSGLAGVKATARTEKKRRLELELIPWFENGKIRVSNADTPFLNFVRKALDEWPYWFLDILDGVYHGVKLFPEVLVIKADTSQHLPSPSQFPRSSTGNAFAEAFSNVRHT